MGTLNILDKTGDTRISWDRDNRDEVKSAKDTFDRLKGKGFLAYTVDAGDGGRGRVLKDFDASLERIILSPPVVGG